MRLRLHLMGLVVATLVPLVIFAAAMVSQVSRHERAAVAQSTREAAQALTAAIDSEVRGSMNALEALSTSTELRTRDLAEFYREAWRTARIQNWAAVMLIDSSGKQLFNLERPFGAPLPSVGERAFFREVVATRRPVVGNLLRDDVSQEAVIPVAMPIFEDDELKYVLAASLRPRRLAELLLGHGLPAGWVASILDRTERSVVRTQPPDGYVGRPGSGISLPPLDGAGSQNESAERVPLYTVVNRSRLSGWTIALAMPADEIEASFRRGMWTTGIAGILTGLVATLLALLLGGRVARAMNWLAASARSLGRQETVVRMPPTAVREVNEVVEAVREAALRLQEHAHERDALLARERAARAEAEEANRAKDEWLATVSHEVRNPLAAIANATAAMVQAGTQTEDEARLLRIVSRQTRNLSRLTEDLLDATRLNTGKIVLRQSPVDLRDVAARSVASLYEAGKIGQQSISLEGDTAVVGADPLRLEQVVGNLIENAVKHSLPDGRILVTVENRGSEAILRVRDDGEGIPEPLLPRVFDLFVQAEPQPGRHDLGLGIGLTLVRRLVELHGGTVTAFSAGRGQGSEFVVRLPALAYSPPAGDPPQTTWAGRRKLRVLVIEDDESVRATTRLFLQAEGHDVEEAPDGPTGLAAILSTDPDVALVDVGLPGYDGYELAKTARQAPRARVRLIAITGYGGRDYPRRAVEAGFDAHLVKPVDPDELARVLTGDAAGEDRGRPGNGGDARVG